MRNQTEYNIIRLSIFLIKELLHGTAKMTAWHSKGFGTLAEEEEEAEKEEEEEEEEDDDDDDDDDGEEEEEDDDDDNDDDDDDEELVNNANPCWMRCTAQITET